MKLFGRLSKEAMKHDWIEYGAGISIFLGLITVLAMLTYFKRWKWLWKDWICIC